MSSVKREYSLPAPGVADAVDVSGNGQDEPAVFYIDVRKSSVFRVDLSFINTTTENSNVDVIFDTFPGAPGAVAGKEITLLVSQNLSIGINELNVSLTENFGPHYSNNYSYLGNIDMESWNLASLKFISDGTNFYPATNFLNPCFLEGSLVQMADGSVKVIEDVKVGDLIVGAFGEVNAILALHRPLLGTGKMCKMNGEHSTTNHHPHVSVDKKFYCNDPKTVNEKTYGKHHKVLNEKGEEVEMLLHGLKKERVQQLTLGVELKTVNGSKKLETLEVYSMSPDTQLYNLVVGGSHTYHVDGYAVTGWPREDDFDYDTWTPRS